MSVINCVRYELRVICIFHTFYFISQFFIVIYRLVVEEAMLCKKKILQDDGVVTSPCARPRKAGHTLLILGGQTFMCDKIYQVKQMLG